MLPEVLEEVVAKLKEFPGLGTRSSRKLALDILQLEESQFNQWVESMHKMRREIDFCSRCGFFASKNSLASDFEHIREVRDSFNSEDPDHSNKIDESQTKTETNGEVIAQNISATAKEWEILCSICSDRKRNFRQICVVEKPTDVLLIEKSENYHGTYFVLNNLISPLDNVFAEDTAVNDLFQVLIPSIPKKEEDSIEVILFFRPGFNAEATTAYIKERINQITSRKIVLSKLAQGLPLYYNPDTLDQATMSLALSDRREVG